MSIRKIFKSNSNSVDESSNTAATNTASEVGSSPIASTHATSTEGTTGVTNVGDRTSGGNLGDRALGAVENRNSTLSAGESRGSGLTGDRVGVASGLTSGTSTEGVNGAEHGSHSGVVEKLGLFGSSHRHGHENTLASKFDPSAESTTHDHKHLHHVTHRDVHHHEVEEVERQREHHRHIHHVQHHVQPVMDVQRPDEIHHQKLHPVTRIHEQHSSTDEDRTLFAGLGEKHRDEESHRPVTRTVVDLGERVNEIVHHHVHHITQPIVKQEVHDRHRIHTVIPLHHTSHESPIIHKSSLHEPVHMADFLKGGGKLGSGISHHQSGVLRDGECTRSVDGVGEKLIRELKLGSHSGSSEKAAASNKDLSSSLTGNAPATATSTAV